MATLDIGLPSVGEMFSGNDIDMNMEPEIKTFVDSTKILNPNLSNYYWMANRDSINFPIITISSGILDSFSIQFMGGVRPVFYINSGMNITGGNGTANALIH